MMQLENFTIVFISILLEAMPFVLIGAFVASFIQIFVSEQQVTKWLPKNYFLGLLMASMMGFVFPVCECAIVPIMRRLIKKGVPMPMAITFMLAVPIMNPVVLLSTYYAFTGNIAFVILRGLLGATGAILIGHIFGLLTRGSSVLKSEPEFVFFDGQVKVVKSFKDKAYDVFAHMSHEFFDVGKYLIIGAMLSALMQSFVPRNLLLELGGNSVLSILVMMVLAFLLSLCSEADAFIARTFLGQFTSGSIIGFLIFGPMIDVKNTLMLLGIMNRKRVVQLILTISVVCFVLALTVNWVGI